MPTITIICMIMIHTSPITTSQRCVDPVASPLISTVMSPLIVTLSFVEILVALFDTQTCIPQEDATTRAAKGPVDSQHGNHVLPTWFGLLCEADPLRIVEA